MREVELCCNISVLQELFFFFLKENRKKPLSLLQQMAFPYIVYKNSSFYQLFSLLFKEVLHFSWLFPNAYTLPLSMFYE